MQYFLRAMRSWTYQRTLKRMLLTCYAGMALLGVALIVVNLIGLALPLRHPDLSQAHTFFGRGDLIIPAQAVFDQTPRQPGEPTAAYVNRLTKLVNEGTAHYWSSGDYNIH